MSDLKDYTYSGNVTFQVTNPIGPRGVVDDTPVQTIVIKSIVNLIPINVHCVIDGVESVVTAYMDYRTQTVQLPDHSVYQLRGSDAMFKGAVLAYFDAERAEVTRQYEEEFPAQETPETQEEED